MIKVIAFDADDTLWVNEPYFRASEEKFCALMGEYMSEHDLERELLKVEIANLGLYGYGIKGFILSMMEAALNVSGGTIGAHGIAQILDLGRQMLNQPIELLEGVEEVLTALKDNYRLVVATKGDLLDQERKLKKSGLIDYFHHVEVMSEKDEPNYRKLLKHLDIQPEEFLMIGNSLKSDVLPVLNIGGHAIHVPFHITWAHEQIEGSIDNERFKNVESIKEVLAVI
jgi:putative hydrolase of the HAD superfamily